MKSKNLLGVLGRSLPALVSAQEPNHKVIAPAGASDLLLSFLLYAYQMIQDVMK